MSEPAYRKFADVPRRAAWIAQVVLLLPVPYLFCLLAGQPLPDGVTGAATDIGYMALTLLLLVPAMLAGMVVLKLYFYGSVMGTSRRGSVQHKKSASLVVIAIGVPLTCLVQAEAFLWLTDRVRSTTFGGMAGNGGWLMLASLPGLVASLLELRRKIAAVSSRRPAEPAP